MQSKIPVSLNLQFWFYFIFYLFIFFKVILCEIKGHCQELVLYYGLMDELGFTFLSTVFQLFRNDGRVNMKGYIQLRFGKKSRLLWDSNPGPRDPKLGSLTAR